MRMYDFGGGMGQGPTEIKEKRLSLHLSYSKDVTKTNQ